MDDIENINAVPMAEVDQITGEKETLQQYSRTLPIKCYQEILMTNSMG